MAGNDEQALELKIDGMRCDGCVQSVQRALTEITGVTDAEVRLDEGRALIRGNGFSVQELIEAVASLGFEAHSF